MDEKVRSLIKAAREILEGDHLWDYHKYLTEGRADPKAIKTQIAVVNLETAISSLAETRANNNHGKTGDPASLLPAGIR